MKLSRESQYALKAMAYLAQHPEGEVLESKEIAEAAGIPPPFAAKILLQLRNAQLVRSHRGARRGYALSRSATEISVHEVLTAIEGPDVFKRCVFWSHPCSESDPCLLHPVWKQVRPQVAQLLSGLSIGAVAEVDPLSVGQRVDLKAAAP